MATLHDPSAVSERPVVPEEPLPEVRSSPLPADTSSGLGAETGPTPRLWFADNLRILCTCIVVLHHVTAMYSGLPFWYYNEKPTNAAVGTGFEIFILFDQAWLMGAFFVLAGYFTPGSYDRKGPRSFLRDRLVRLGIPLVVFYYLLNPLLCLPAHLGRPLLEDYPGTTGPGPLWFAFTLLVLDVSYAAVRVVVGTRTTGLCLSLPLTRRSTIVFAVGLAFATYLWRIPVPIGYRIPVLDVPSSHYIPQYVSFFVLGIVAFRRDWFRTVPAWTGRAGLGMAVAATAVFLPLSVADGFDPCRGAGTLGSLLFALWDSFFAVGTVLAVFTLFRRRFDTTGRRRRYLSAHAFTVYVIHAFVVTGAGYLLSGLHLPTLIKMSVAALAVPVSYLLAGPVRRIPGVRRVL